MNRILKVASKTAIVFGIFISIISANLLVQTYEIQEAKKDSKEMQTCVNQVRSRYLGCLIDGFPVLGGNYMYFSAFVFIFLSLLLFKPNIQYIYLTPLFAMVWVLLSEAFINLFKISVLQHPFLLGDFEVFYGLYYNVGPIGGLAFIFTLFISCISGYIAFFLKKFAISNN